LESKKVKEKVLKETKVRVEFAKIKVEINNEIVSQLLPLDITVHRLEDLRRYVENWLFSFTSSTSRIIYKALSNFTRPTYYFTIPAIRVMANNDNVCACRFSSFSGGAEELDISRWAMLSSLISYIESVVTEVCTNEIIKKGVDLAFTDGTIINCTVIKRSRKKWELLLTQSMLKYARGGGVRIRYGSSLHNILWQIKEAKDVQIEPKIRESLAKLELIDSEGHIVPRGERTLEELNEINPSTNPKLVMPFASALLGYELEAIPISKFVRDNDFVRNINHRGQNITAKGKEWLVDNCYKILQHKSCTNGFKIELIPYIPMECLSEFLASNSETIRMEARRRARELSIKEKVE
jgi:hypothetical protein